MKYSKLFKEHASFDTLGNAWFTLDILRKIGAKHIMLSKFP